MQKINQQQRHFFTSFRLTLVVILGFLLLGAGGTYAASSSENNANVPLSPPSRIVSLVPAITEIIAALKADQALVGITYHTTRPARLGRCTVVGGFMVPSLERIKGLHPDLVFISSMHKGLRDKLAGSRCRVIELTITSLADAYAGIKLIGRLLGKDQEAARLIENLQAQLALIRRKVERIPLSERRRVIPMLGMDKVLVSGDDSFQNELIAVAGGIPPVWGKKGVVVSPDKAAVLDFNPQFIYAGGVDRQEIMNFFNQPVWAEMAAVKTGDIHFFPGALTSRAATHFGDFVAWLAATIYPDHFSRPGNMVLREEVRERRALELDFNYVKKAEVVETIIADFKHRTLVVDLAEPMQIISTLEGPRQGVTTVGNHYLPPSTWNFVHRLGSVRFEDRVVNLLERQSEATSLLFTGADMKHLVQQSTAFKEMKVTALVTAGVCSNAVRMGAEEGRYYELEEVGDSAKPGTINIIILTNMRLTPRAMSRAVISACEGKSAALQDLDIRSAVRPAFLQATGTGTDNVLVVEGRGQTIKHTGGHSKMGELIARAVYEGVIEAVRRQNALTEKRSLFHRLQERRVTVYSFLKACRINKGVAVSSLLAPVEELLLDRRYAAFVESSLALSDAWQRRQLSNLESFKNWCRRIAEEIAGQPLEDVPHLY
ncbi:MAG: helical backbone metal receptor, partial [Pseudomonadota bacterium]|nr:helical backbone metal receptor [Pseudomonadota bacterium]